MWMPALEEEGRRQRRPSTELYVPRDLTHHPRDQKGGGDRLVDALGAAGLFLTQELVCEQGA